MADAGKRGVWAALGALIGAAVWILALWVPFSGSYDLEYIGQHGPEGKHIVAVLVGGSVSGIFGWFFGASLLTLATRRARLTLFVGTAGAVAWFIGFMIWYGMPWDSRLDLDREEIQLLLCGTVMAFILAWSLMRMRQWVSEGTDTGRGPRKPSTGGD